MTLQRNYYEVLGIPSGATTDQIKKKYRELARKYHPDIAQDKALGQRLFTQINQAYRVLADPDRRAQYNSQLTASSAAKPVTVPSAPVMTRVQTAPPHVRPTPQTVPAQPQQVRSQQVRSQQVRPQQVRPQQVRPQQPQPVNPQISQADTGAAQKAQAIAGRLKDADNAIMAGKGIEARAFCVKVLEIDPRNLKALEILGDALVLMGQREDAAVQYRNALQVASSSMIQAKLNRLEQGAASTRTNPPGGESEKTGGGLFGRFLGKK